MRYSAAILDDLLDTPHASPLTVKLTDLPEVTPERLRDFASRAVKLLTELGYEDVKMTGTYAGKPASNDVPEGMADLPGNIARGRSRLHDLVRNGEVAREGHGGHEMCFGVAVELVRDLALVTTAADLMLEHWYPHCDPNTDPEFVRERCRSALTSGQNEIGAFATRPAAETFAGFAEQVAKLAADTGAKLADDAPYKYPAPLTGRELVNGVFTPTRYMLQGFLMELVVNLLYGDGGVGKTTLAEHMAIAVAAGIPLFGRETTQAPALLVLGEDGYGDTRARLHNICQHLGVRLEDLPLPGEDITLAEVTDVGGITFRPFYRELAQRLEKTPGTFVTLDSLIDIGILNESQRGGMNAFMKKVVGGLCNQFRATPLVLGHPSKASMADGTYYSGSTAAKNSVRNQLIMKQPNKGLLRTLEIGRQSYGGADSIDIIWTPGSVFKTRDDAGIVQLETVQRADVLARVLELIDQGTRIVQAHGTGQKPKDIAADLAKRGIKVAPKEVRAILTEAEREGVLVYTKGRGHVAAGKRQ